MHVGAGGTVGQPERAWLPASLRVTRSAPMAWALRARAPVAAGSLPRATRSAPKAGALRARAPTCALRVTAHVVSWGEWGCRRRRALRAAREARCKACFELLPRARVGWHTTRTSVPPPTPRSSGVPVRWLMARGRRASGVAAAPRSHAAGAPTARRRRAVGGACACRARSNGRRRPLVVVVADPELQVRALIVFRRQMFARIFAISRGVRAHFARGPCACTRRSARHAKNYCAQHGSSRSF